MAKQQRGKCRKVRIDQVYDRNNLIEADRHARKGKRTHHGVREFDKNREANLNRLQRQLQQHTYHTSPGTEVEQWCPCGKTRLLHKLPYFPDHIENHALMQVILPVMERYFYYDSSASIKGKGMHFAARRTEHYISCHRNEPRLLYVKLDFVKFYHNINQKKCFDWLCTKFGNLGIRYLLWEIVTACRQGLGIGLYPIQPIANFYTSPLCRMLMALFDVWVEIYCDDLVIIGTDKKEVWRAVNFVKDYAEHVMEQPLHQNIGMQIIDEHHFLDFVGYRFYYDHILLRKRMKKKFKEKVSRLKDPLRRYQVMVSYRGWLMHCNGYNLWQSVTGMKSFKDWKMPKIERRDKHGHRILDGIKVNINSLLDHEIEFHDVEYGLPSRYKGKDGDVGRECAAIQVMDGGRKLKFITSAPGIIEALRFAQEKGEWPIRGTISSHLDGNFTVYEIE